MKGYSSIVGVIYNNLITCVLIEPEWIEVVTELLLSMMSQGSNFARLAAKTIFSCLTEHVTPDSLGLITDVRQMLLNIFKYYFVVFIFISSNDCEIIHNFFPHREYMFRCSCSCKAI